MAFKYGPNSSQGASDLLVRGLGLFSLGLGAAELIAPGKIAKAIGLEGKENLLRAYGLREIGAGVGTLSTDPQPALWARFGGDFLDLATIAWGAKDAQGDQRKNAMIAAGAVAGIAVLDALAAVLTSKRGGDRPPPADFSDRSGLPKGVEASRGYYQQMKERGPAVAQHDARKDRTHSSERAEDAKTSEPSKSGSSDRSDARPETVATDMSLPPIAPDVATSV